MISMYKELMINSEELDEIKSYHKFKYLGEKCLYKEDYGAAITYIEEALDALVYIVPGNIKFILENLSRRLLFLGLRNELRLQLGIAYRKKGNYYRALDIFEGLIEFTKDFYELTLLGFKENLLGYYPIPRDKLVSKVWNEIGLIYKDLKLYDKALNAFYKSTHVSLIKNPSSYHNPWLEIAFLHEQLGDFKSAKSAERKFEKTMKLIIKRDKKRYR